jgi:hypothetical protein
MHVQLSYRKAFYVGITLFWLLTMGMLMERHYGTFQLSVRSSGPDLQGILTPLEISQEQWMGVYLNGEKIGYLWRKISPAASGYTMDEAFRIKMIVMGTAKDVETLLNANLDKNLKLLSFTAKIKADLDIEISGSVLGKDLSLTIDSAGVKTTKKIHLGKEPTLEGPAITKMLRGLKPGDRISIPIFDPALMGVEDLELKVAAKENIMSLGKLQEAYKVKGNMKGIEFTVWITEEGEVLREESPTGFLLVKETKENALKVASPSLDLISQAAVPFGMKLPANISYLKVRITNINFKGLELDGGRQKLTGNLLAINKEVLDTRLKTRNTEISGKAFDEYLKDTIFIQSKDPQIMGLAREIIKNEKDPLVAARLIYDWVYRNIEKTPTITVPMATDVLRTKKGDCNEHTTLFTALARAAKIPAKIAVGLTYKDGFFYYHAWPEVYAGQWMAVDPTLGQFPADASHIRLITGDLDKQMQILPVINKIRIEGLEYR